MEGNLVTFFVTCFVAIGFITGTSLLLVNTVGVSLYRRENGSYKFKNERAQKLRDKIRSYPNKALILYFLIAVVLVALVNFGKMACEREWVMAGFSAVYITWVLDQIRYFCSSAFDTFADDEYD